VVDQIFICARCGSCCTKNPRINLVIDKNQDAKKSSKSKIQKGNQEKPQENAQEKNQDLHNFIVYPEESDILQVMAKTKNIEVKFFEVDIIPDVKNKKIIVPKFSIEPLDNGNCPFLKNNQCAVYDQRPLSCRAYPICLVELEPNKPSMEIDFSCQYLKDLAKMGYFTEDLDINAIKRMFPIEFRAISQLFNREKLIFHKLKKMIENSEIDINQEITLETFKEANEKWERFIIYTENA
jgi:Fe-S-cluster containining protein